MVYKDYYKILEIDTNRVSIEQIKNAYRLAAKKYHPDVNIGDQLAEEKIKDINEAYRILSVPSSKKKYDRIWNAKNDIKNTQKLKGNTILNMFLGNIEKENNAEKNNSKEPIRGESVETEISVSISDAYYGVEKKIVLRTIEGKMKTFTIKVPQGIRNGEKVRLIGQGKQGKNGGKNGDLFIKVIIEDNKTFSLKGYDLYTDLYLSPWEAALGTRVTVKTIDDETKIYIPKGIQSGEIIKIPAKGYKNGTGERGDLIAQVKIIVPKQLTENEEKLFKKLEEISRFNPRNA